MNTAKLLSIGLPLAVLLAGCNDRPRVTTPASAPVTLASPAMQPASPSLYPLGLDLRDQHGTAVKLDLFRGSPVIVSMFYGTCPAACPLIVSHVKQIEASLPPEVRARTRVLLVSFDPEHDTPAALTEIAARHRVDAGRWRFAVGHDDEVRQLANALGVTYQEFEGGFFTHNSVISVLDGEGRIVGRVDDPQADLAPLATAVTRAARGS